MTYSELIITFNSDLIVNDVLTFDISDGVSTNTITEVWKDFRVKSNQVPLGLTSPGATTGENSAINFITAFNLDYNATGIYDVSRVLNVVSIKSTIPNIDFSNGVNADVTFTYNNFIGTALEISSLEYIESINPCTHVKLRVTTSIQADSMSSPISQSVTTNPFEFEVLRSGGVLPKNINVTVETNDSQIATLSTIIPNTLTVDNLDIVIVNSPNGATVQIFVNNSTGLNLQYSLDNATWQTDNIFTGQASGDYTLYVKDQLGCSVSKTYSVSDVSVVEPFYYLSKSNSFRFVVESIGGVATDKRIDANRMSCNDDVELPYKIYQRFKNTDIIPTQLKSNYETRTIKVIDTDGNQTILNDDQLTTNRGLKDSRDCIMYNYGDAKTGIYFTSGNKYNYDTGIDTGEDYTLNGALPEWGVVGNYINIDTAWFQIKDIIFDDEKLAEVLLIEKVYTGLEVVKKVSIIYDRENYDVFEFSVDMSLFNLKVIEIEISLNGTNVDEVILRSEKIQVGDTTDFKEIIYYNDTNTDVLYTSGIQNKLWLRTEKIDKKPIGESENHQTDNDVILIDASSKEAKNFIFESIPEALMVKLFIALHHRKLFINGEKYVLQEAPEIEGGIEDTNLYDLTVTLIKTNEVYNAKSSDSSTPNVGGILEVPALINISTGGFIKI